MTSKFGFTTTDEMGDKLREAAYRDERTYASQVRYYIRQGLACPPAPTYDEELDAHSTEWVIAQLRTLSDVLRPGKGPRLVAEAARRLEAQS